MKRHLTLTFFILNFLHTNAQQAIGDFNFDFKKHSIKLSGGYNMFEPIKSKANNAAIFIGYNYVHRIYGDGVKDPIILIQLNPFFSYCSLYNDSLNYPVNLIGPGSFNFNPRLYIVGKPYDNLKLYWYGGTGIKFIPPRKSEISHNHKFLGNAIEQRMFSFGVGFTYNDFLNVNASYNHHWHDLSSRTKKYFQSEIDPSLYGRSYNIFATFNLFTCTKEDWKRTLSMLAYGDFTGYVSGFNKDRIISFGTIVKITLNTKKGNSSPGGQPTNQATGQPKEPPKEESKEQHKKPPKEQPKEPSKDQPKN